MYDVVFIYAPNRFVQSGLRRRRHSSSAYTIHQPYGNLDYRRLSWIRTSDYPMSMHAQRKFATNTRIKARLQGAQRQVNNPTYLLSKHCDVPRTFLNPPYRLPG